MGQGPSPGAAFGGHDILKAMREVSRNWKAGYESSVARIKLSHNGQNLPPGGAFAQRFPAARSVDLFVGWKAQWRPIGSLGCLFGARITSLVLQGMDSLTDAGLAHLRGAPLTLLDLYGCAAITDAGLGFLRGAPLTDLDLGFCDEISPAGLAHLSGMPLRRLNLPDWDSIEADPDALSPLAGLPLTDLSPGRFLVDSVLAPLLGLPLTRLDPRFSGISDAGLGQLSRLPLKSLDLEGCDRLTPEGLTQLRGLPLRRLGLTEWRGFRTTPQALAPLAGLPLTDLNLGFSDVPDAGVALLRGLSLTRLSLHGCTRLTPACMTHLVRMPLKTLYLGSCAWESSPDIESFYSCLQRLPLTALQLDTYAGAGVTAATLGNI